MFLKWYRQLFKFGKYLLRFILPESIYRSAYFDKIRLNMSGRFFQVFDELKGNSFWLYVRTDSFMEQVIEQHGLYSDWEKESLKIWAVLSTEANVVVDVGANTGIYSLLAQNHNPKARIIAFEPIPINYKILTKNIKRNRYQITVIPKALSNETGFSSMYMLENRLNYMTSVNQNRYELHPEIVGGNSIVETQITTIDFETAARDHSIEVIDLVKIDAEGHEVEIVTGMLTYIKRFRPSILLEVISDENAEKLNSLFHELDYSFVSITEDKLSHQVDKLWNNDHHNFLVCSRQTVQQLKSKGLVV